MLARLIRRLWRGLFWRTPGAQLRAFAETESYGARDLAHAAELVKDPWLSRQLLRHAQDEVRHAVILEEGTPEPAQLGLGASVIGDSPAETGLDFEQLGEVRFLAFVHLAEKRAVREFQLHQRALGADGARLDSILNDERRHVAWTGHALDRLRDAGRGAEVDAALRALRIERWKNAGLSILQRLSSVLSVLTLSLVYALLLGPFCLLAGAWRVGWQASVRAPIDRAY